MNRRPGRNRGRVRQVVPVVSGPPAMIEPDAEGDPQEYSFQDGAQTNTSTLQFPAGYDPDDTEASWPVYWILHGKNGSAATVVTTLLAQLNAAIAAGLLPDGIKVIPDFGPATWWTDRFDGTFPARTMLNNLRARLLLVTRASVTDADWHLIGFSMGGFGAASWFADDPTAWGSVMILGGANMSTTDNNFGAGEADETDYATVFGSNAAYLESETPAQKWVANAAAINAAGVPILTALGASDAVVSSHMATFRTLIGAAGILRADDTIPSATHSMSSYATNYGTRVGSWAGAIGYSFKADTATWVQVFDMQDPASFQQTAGVVTHLTNLISSVTVNQAANGPAYDATGLNGKACMNFNGTDQHFFGGEAAVTNEVSGSDQPHTILVVYQADTPDAAATIYGFANNASANGFEVFGTNVTGSGRLRMTKGDDVPALSTCAQSTDTNTSPHQVTWRTTSGTALTGRLDRVAMTLTSSTYDRGTTTMNRWCIGARVRNSGPTIDERFDGKVGFAALAGSEISDDKLWIAEFKLKQQWLLSASG